MCLQMIPVHPLLTILSPLLYHIARMRKPPSKVSQKTTRDRARRPTRVLLPQKQKCSANRSRWTGCGRTGSHFYARDIFATLGIMVDRSKFREMGQKWSQMSPANYSRNGTVHPLLPHQQKTLDRVQNLIHPPIAGDLEHLPT